MPEKSRRSLLKTIGVASGVGLAGCISDTDEIDPSKPESKLFIQKSENAEIKKTTANKYKITLQNIDSRVTWFGDRPERNAGELNTQQFIDSWKRYGFKSTPPNAALTGLHNGERKIVTVELKNPEYNKKENTLTYTGKKLNHNPGGNLERLHRQKKL